MMIFLARTIRQRVMLIASEAQNITSHKKNSASEVVRLLQHEDLVSEIFWHPASFMCGC